MANNNNNSSAVAGSIFLQLQVANQDSFQDKVAKIANGSGATAGKSMKTSFFKTLADGFGMGIGIAFFNKIAAAAKGVWDTFTSGAEEAYKTQLEAETRLAQVMRNTMDATKAEIQATKDWASALQEVGVIGDEVTMSGLQELGTYVGDPESLRKMSVVLGDMLAQQYGLNATAENAVTISTMLGKVLEGQTSALSRYGYSFTEAQEQLLKYGTEEQRVATLAEVVEASVGGMNEALARTPAGQMQQLSNYMGDVKEKFGEAAMNIKTSLLPLAQKFADILDAIADKLVFITEQIKVALRNIGWIDYSDEAVNAFGAAGNAIADIMADSAGSISDAYADAVKDAKKSLEGLADFDQINKLTGSSDEDNSEISSYLDDDSYRQRTKAAEETTKATTSIFDKFFNELSKKWRKFWDSYGDDIAKVGDYFKRQGERVKGLFQSIGSALSEWWGEHGDEVTERVQTIIGLVARLADGLWDIGMTFWEKWGPRFAVGLANISNWLLGLVADYGPAVVDWFIEQAQRVYGIIDSVLEVLSAWWAEHGDHLLSSLGKILAVLVDVGKYLWDKIASWAEKWLPILAESLADFIDGMAELIAEWAPFIGEALKPAIDGLAIAADILGFIVSALLSELPEALSVVLKTISLMVYGVFKGLELAIEGIIKAVFWLGDAAQSAGRAVGGVISWIWDTAKSAGQAVGSVINWIWGVAESVGNAVGGVIRWIGNAAEAVGNAVGNVINLVWSAAESAGKAVGKAINWVWNAAKSAGNALSGVVDWLKGVIGYIGDAAETIGNAVGNAINWIGNAAESAGRAVGSVINWLKGAVGHIGDAAQSAGRAVRGVIDNVVGFFKDGIDKIMDFFEGAIDFVVSIPSKVADVLVSVGEGIYNAISGFISSIADFIGQIGDWAYNLGQTVGSSVKGFIGNVKEFISNTIESIKGFFSDFFSGIKSAVSTVCDSVVGFFGGMWDNIKGFFSSAKGWISDFWNSFCDMAKAPINFIIGLINRLIDMINNVSFDMPDFLGGGHFGFSISHIPMLANGGIATKPTLAMVGEGAQDEAIVPLDSFKRDIAQIVASTVTQVMAAMSRPTADIGGDNDTPIQLQVNIAGRNFYDETIREINRRSRNSGKCVINV